VSKTIIDNNLNHWKSPVQEWWFEDLEAKRRCTSQEFWWESPQFGNHWSGKARESHGGVGIAMGKLARHRMFQGLKGSFLSRIEPWVGNTLSPPGCARLSRNPLGHGGQTGVLQRNHRGPKKGLGGRWPNASWEDESESFKFRKRWVIPGHGRADACVGVAQVQWHRISYVLSLFPDAVLAYAFWYGPVPAMRKNPRTPLQFSVLGQFRMDIWSVKRLV